MKAGKSRLLNRAIFELKKWSVELKLKDRLREILFYCFRIFPVQKKKVLFDNFIGRGYGCNPKYIARALKQIDPSLDVVWLARKELMKCDREGGRNVKLGSLRSVYEQATAKVWVANNRQKEYVRKRANQVYLQTWHGAIGIKKCEGDMGDLVNADWKRCAINDSRMIDMMISNSKFCTDVYKRAFWYNGPVWEVGYPRNDLMLNPNEGVFEKVRKSLNLASDVKLFLYAPTFRKVRTDWQSDSLDLEKVLAALEKKFGGNWVCLLRLHPFAIKANEGRIQFSDRVVNASKYEDMQELMCAADVLCTDYSSCIFDFILSRKPALMYAPDMEHYLQERSFHFDPYKLPFSCSLSNDEIVKAIDSFDDVAYQKAIDAFIESEQVIEKGCASQKVAELVASICAEKPIDPATLGRVVR